MVSRMSRFGLLLLCTCGVAALVSCPSSPPPDPDPDPQWTFASDVEGWSFPFDPDVRCVNPTSILSWLGTQGSPGAGCLKIEASFDTDGEYVSVVAPIVEDPLTAGTDLSTKEFTVKVQSVDIPVLAVIFAASYDTAWRSKDNGGTNVAAATWTSTEFTFAETDPPFEPDDVRFLGVLLQPPMGMANGTYIFYIDTAVISDAP
jgi:hypothetical protein